MSVEVRHLFIYVRTPLLIVTRLRLCPCIFVDPHVDAVSGKYVVVMIEDTAEATFKQLIVEGGRQYLKALNPEWPNRIIEVNQNARICGVVVFKGEMV